MDASVVAQIVLGGLLLGGVYAMAALGLSLIFGVSRVLNLAHGDFLMLGALFERLFIRPIAEKEFHERLIASVLVTLGLSLALSDTAAFFWGTFVKGVPISMPPLVVAGIFL